MSKSTLTSETEGAGETREAKLVNGHVCVLLTYVSNAFGSFCEVQSRQRFREVERMW